MRRESGEASNSDPRARCRTASRGCCDSGNDSYIESDYELNNEISRSDDRAQDRKRLRSGIASRLGVAEPGGLATDSQAGSDRAAPQVPISPCASSVRAFPID